MTQTFKARIQSFLRRIRIYDRVKASWLYGLYWFLVDKSVLDRRRTEVQFYRDALLHCTPGALIIDVGANQGAKTDIFLRLGARVVAVEPDESSRETLRLKFMRYRLRRKPVTIVGKAVSDTCGVERIWIEDAGSGMNTLSQKWADTLRSDEIRFGRLFQFKQTKPIETVTLQELISTHGEPAFVKIDVEGYELKVMRGLQSPVACLSFEVNLPEFREEGKECVRELMRTARDGIFNYVVDCQEGFARAEWVCGNAFQKVLDGCKEDSIEVFWRTAKRPQPVDVPRHVSGTRGYPS